MKWDIKIHNCFDVIKKDSDGNIVQEGHAENIILNNMWTDWRFPNAMNYIHFGSGTAEPQAADTKLTAHVGYKSTSEASAVRDFSKFRSHGVVSVKKSIRLEPAENVGANISEVGISNDNSTTSGLLTKAILKDANGNPLSITKGASDTVDIFATVFINLGMSHQGGSIKWLTPKVDIGSSLGKSLLGELLCKAQATSTVYATYGLCRPQPQISGQYSMGDSNDISGPHTCTVAYNSTTRTMAITVPNIGTASGNRGDGYRGLVVGSDIGIDLPNSGFAMPEIVKEVIGTGDGSLKDFSTLFGWIKNNGSLKMYVNDVEVTTGFTVDYNRSKGSTYFDKELIVVESNWLASDGVSTQWGPPSGTHMGVNYAAGVYTVFENPYYATFAIESVRIGGATLYCSDDLTNWTQAVSRDSLSGAVLSIPSELRGNRYWKVVASGYTGNTTGCYNFVATGWAASKLVHFASAPASGATISCTYQPDCIGKDSNHILSNVLVNLTLNEYTP